MIRQDGRHIDVQTALASILYTLCKVRGAKVIVGFLNNEPRYLEPILTTLENVTLEEQGDAVDWKVPYVLLLWLSHLLLTPFDLASISANSLPEGSKPIGLEIHHALPSVAQRIIRLGTEYLSASTKAQDAAAAMLVRLATRPDMQQLQVADALLIYAVSEISSPAESSTTIYRQLGPLRFLAGVATSADLSHLMPIIYRTCERLGENEGISSLTGNAVGKKLIVKIYRNIAILTLRLPSTSGAVLSFLETTSVLEEVIDHLLQSLGDRDTPVRYAAAKAISLIISELQPEMGHEVIQAVLDTFKEDIPRSTKGVDYQTVNALKWHGLTLTLSHALFKRSASPSQLPDILNALVSALNFEQRTATGSSIGTNVRDAANFGIWSLSRRYTSDELLSVDTNVIRLTPSTSNQTTVIQAMAVQLLLSACLDPAGNIRRGSSAALQELIGRHPNQVVEGISVVQIVDYQAVGLRKRGLIDVAGKAASLDYTYWEALVDGLIAWRGLRSVDVPSREAAAYSLARLAAIREGEDGRTFVAGRLLDSLEGSSSSDVETMHGLVCSLSNLLDLPTDAVASEAQNALHRRFWLSVQSRGVSRIDFTPRSLKSELPVAMAKLVTGVCRIEASYLAKHEGTQDPVFFEDMGNFVQRLLARHEDPILLVVPDMVKQLGNLQKALSQPPDCIAVETLSRAVAADGSKAVLAGAGRAIALGTVALRHADELHSDVAALAISSLANLVTARNVDWRIIGLRALHLVLAGIDDSVKSELQIIATVVQATHAGLTDYTIDERGDIGSLVRLQGLICVSSLLSLGMLAEDTESCELLQADVLRLSLEKLDRVRARAAETRQKCLPAYFRVEDRENINSQAYLSSALESIFNPDCPPWALRALVEGAISSAGISAESLLQSSREILTRSLYAAKIQHIQTLFTIYSEVLRDSVASITQKSSVLVLPTLEALAFFLDMRVLQRLVDPSNEGTTTAPFKWRSLLSSVQKSHHKSSDVMKLLAAVRVYGGLAEVESIRGEVVKKLLSMLTTNPYPRIRVAVAEVVFEVLEANEMKGVNWAEKGGTQSKMVADLKGRFVGSV
jgi:hypothetical protein